jgi:anti-sigma factor RsiW
MLSCIRYRNRLGPYLDGELNMRQNEAVAAHAEKCQACRTVMEELRGLRTTLLAVDISTPPSKLTARILAEARARYQTGKVLNKRPDHRHEPSLPWVWAFQAAMIVAILTGLTTGAYLGWDLRQEENAIFTKNIEHKTVHDLYALETFSATPDGSIEAAALALLGDRQ